MTGGRGTACGLATVDDFSRLLSVSHDDDDHHHHQPPPTPRDGGTRATRKQDRPTLERFREEPSVRAVENEKKSSSSTDTPSIAKIILPPRRPGQRYYDKKN